MEQEFDCQVQCVKVDSLRRTYDDNMHLERWCKDPNNVLCCRKGRVAIYEPDPKDPTKKVNHIFMYPKSKWCNPYKVGEDGTLEMVLAKFERHILSSMLRDELHELVGKTLGCFCNQKAQCHIQILQKLVTMRNKLPELPDIPPEEILSSTIAIDGGEKKKCVAWTKNKKRCGRYATIGKNLCIQHQEMAKREEAAKAQ